MAEVASAVQSMIVSHAMRWHVRTQVGIALTVLRRETHVQARNDPSAT